MGCCLSTSCLCLSSYSHLNDIRQKQQYAIVTGATSGIGCEVAKELHRFGINVLLVGRSAERLENTKQQIMKVKVKKNNDTAIVETAICDFTSLTSIRKFAQSVRDRQLPLVLLVNNVGVALEPFRFTEDGFETHFQVNFLSHFVLTMELLPLLRQQESARIVNVSSIAQFQGGLNLSLYDQTQDQQKRSYDAWSSYCSSKLLQILFTVELQRRLCLMNMGHVTAVSCHPGVIRSNLWRNASFLACCMFKLSSDGAKPVLKAALQPGIPPASYTVPCCCFQPRGRIDSRASCAQKHGRELWELAVKWSKLSAEYDMNIGNSDQTIVISQGPAIGHLCALLGICPCCMCCF